MVKKHYVYIHLAFYSLMINQLFIGWQILEDIP